MSFVPTTYLPLSLRGYTITGCRLSDQRCLKSDVHAINLSSSEEAIQITRINLLPETNRSAQGPVMTTQAPRPLVAA